MGFLGRLFGTDKAINHVLDKDNGLLKRTGDWVDHLNYTDEEKAKDQYHVREWGLRYLDALAPFKIVQRILAFSAAFLWISIGLNVAIAIWVRALHPEIDAATPMMEFALSDYIFWPVIAVFSLYMSGGTVNSLKGIFPKK